MDNSESKQRCAINVLYFLLCERGDFYGNLIPVAALVKLHALDALSADQLIAGARYDCLLDVLHNPWDGDARSLGLVPLLAPSAQIEIMSIAAHHGMLDAIRWLRANGWAWDGTVCGHALVSIDGVDYPDHPELRRWLPMNGCPWDDDTDAFLMREFGEEEMQELREAMFRDWQANSLHYHSRGHRKLEEFFSPRRE